MKRLMLLSNSTNLGEGYLDHAMKEIRAHLAGARRLVFVPFAIQDHAAYIRRVAERFAREGIEVTGLAGRAAEGAAGRPVAEAAGRPVAEAAGRPVAEAAGRPVAEAAGRHVAEAAGRGERPAEMPGEARILEQAEAIFVGGGNTFRLLDALQRGGLLDVIRRRVAEGMPYLGSSAGSVIAAPTLKTTNDMPIVQPRSFEALGLVPFQINAHYIDADPASRHMGETREDRIREFLEENDTPVVGLREGAWLRVVGESVRLEGRAGARVFRRGAQPVELAPGSTLDLAVLGTP